MGNMLVVGIDPGKQGAVATLFSDGSLDVLDLSDFYDDSGAAHSSVNPGKFGKWIRKRTAALGCSLTVCCEKPIFVGGGFTIKTPMSMFESYGVIRGVCAAHGLSFIGVNPREWQKHYPALYHPKQKRTKEESVVEAKRLFPNYADVFEYEVLKGRCKGNTVLLDGRAEAALIARYAQDVVSELRDAG